VFQLCSNAGEGRKATTLTISGDPHNTTVFLHKTTAFSISLEEPDGETSGNQHACDIAEIGDHDEDLPKTRLICVEIICLKLKQRH
jgi:hypothetical protein